MMFAEEVSALVECHRMREHMANVFELHAGRGDQVVRNAQPHFGVNKNVTLKQKIKMLSDRTSKRVLHGNHRSCGATGFQRVKNLDRGGTCQYISAAHQLQRRLMAEGSQLSLDGDSHRFCRFAPNLRFSGRVSPLPKSRA